MTNTKMTNRIALTTALEYIPESRTDVREKLTKMIDQLDKKNAAPKKLTATQEANATTCKALVEFFSEHDEAFTASDLLKVCPAVKGMSNQKVSAILKQAVDAERIIKFSEKRRTYFARVGFKVAEG